MSVSLYKKTVLIIKAKRSQKFCFCMLVSGLFKPPVILISPISINQGTNLERDEIGLFLTNETRVVVVI